MIRKKRLYQKPRKSYESSRIAEENEIVKKYGLKNKREIWKSLAKVNYFRGRAKALAKSPQEEQEVLFRKLKALGLKASSIAEILDLKVEDILDRRLQTLVSKNKLANTPKQARQLIVHKKILVGGKTANSPSYLVSLAEEKTINVKSKKKKIKTPAPAEEIPAEKQAEEKQ